MHVQESENLGLRKSDSMQDSPGLEARVFAQLNYHHHTESPIPLFMAFWQPEVPVKLASDRAYGPIRDDSQRGMHVHARHESIARRAIRVHALIDQAHSANNVVIDQRFADGRSRPKLHSAGT